MSSLAMNTNFVDLSIDELDAINGGGILENLAGIAIGVISAVAQAGGAGYLGAVLLTAAASPVVAGALTVAAIAGAVAAVAYVIEN